MGCAIFFLCPFGAEQGAFCLNCTKAIDRAVCWKDFSKCTRSEHLEKVVERRFVNKQMWWAFLENSFCRIVVTAMEQQLLVFLAALFGSVTQIWRALLQPKGKKCPECACKMPKALLLLWATSDFEQGNALLVVTVGLRVGDSALCLLMGKWLGRCLWNPQLQHLCQNTHLGSFHCHPASWALSLAVSWYLSMNQKSACHCHLSPPSSPVPASASLLCKKVQTWKKGGAGWCHLMQPRFCFRCTQPALTKVMLPSAASWNFTCGWICNKLKVLLVFVACKDQSADLRSYWQFGFLSYMKYMGEHFILVMQTTLCLISLTW